LTIRRRSTFIACTIRLCCGGSAARSDFCSTRIFRRIFSASPVPIPKAYNFRTRPRKGYWRSVALSDKRRTGGEAEVHLHSASIAHAGGRVRLNLPRTGAVLAHAPIQPAIAQMQVLRITFDGSSNYDQGLIYTLRSDVVYFRNPDASDGAIICSRDQTLEFQPDESTLLIRTILGRSCRDPCICAHLDRRIPGGRAGG
jgi:hypothetical protein